VTERAIHIHEDDWGMRSMHPAAASKEVSAELARAIAAGEANRAPDGLGWTAMHVIQEPTFNYESAGLAVATAEHMLAVIMPRVRKFTATATAGFDPGVRDPLGSYEEDALCFGFDANCFIKLEASDDLVREIWFEARAGDQNHLLALRRAIEAIDTIIASVIVDYWLDLTGSVRDNVFLDRYFRLL
jgi:hypothetical protein